MPVHYGFSDEDWSRMVAAGYDFLAEIAAQGKTTSYPEFCAQVFDRTALRVEATDAALGGLLAGVAERSRAEKAVILPAVLLVAARGEPGAGFFAYAAEVGLLTRRPTKDAKFMFWAGHLRAVFAAYEPA